jgi:hypothetical protein
MVSSRKAVGAQNGSIFGVKAPGEEQAKPSKGGKNNGPSKAKPEPEKEEPVPTLEEVGWVLTSD